MRPTQAGNIAGVGDTDGSSVTDGPQMDDRAMKLIYEYTRQQAIEDGVLMRFEDYAANEGGLIGTECIETQLEMIRIPDARFSLGELIITPAAAEAVRLEDAIECLIRHQLGDWGEVCQEDRQENEQALIEECRILSVYHLDDRRNEGETIRIYVITECSREATTLLLPGDY